MSQQKGAAWWNRSRGTQSGKWHFPSQFICFAHPFILIIYFSIQRYTSQHSQVQVMPPHHTVLVMKWSWIPSRAHHGNLSRNRTLSGVLTPSLDAIKVPFHTSNGEPAPMSCAALQSSRKAKTFQVHHQEVPLTRSTKSNLSPLQNGATTCIQTKSLSLPLVCWDCFSPSHLSFFVEHESKPGLVVPTL